jgi:hypothetical protein
MRMRMRMRMRIRMRVQVQVHVLLLVMVPLRGLGWQERTRLAELTRQVQAADAEIEASKANLARYRAEFEQLRAALLVDRLAKNRCVPCGFLLLCCRFAG